MRSAHPDQLVEKLSGRALGERARRRLRIAAGLLGRTALLRTPAGDDWCFDVLRVIGRLPAAQRERLKCQVDWVEAYDIAEAIGHRVWSPARAHR